MTPKFQSGDTAKLANGIIVTIKWPNIHRKPINNYSGFVDEFTGTYYCSWLDKDGKAQEGDIAEALLSNT